MGEKGSEIWKYVEKHGMHRIEDETFLESFVKAEKISEVREEKVEEESEEKERDEPKTRKKAGKNLTLDSFFS